MTNYKLETLDTVFQAYEALYNDMLDPPIFYQIDFLRAYQITKKNIVYIFYETQNEELIRALPVENSKGYFLNISSRGWDNLKIIEKENTKSTISEFLNAFLSVNKSLFLTNFCLDKNIHPVSKILVETKDFRCPILVLPNSIDSILQSVSKKFRYNIKYQNSLCERSGVNFDITRLNEIPQNQRIEKFEHVLRLHAKRFKSKGEESKFLNSDSKDFHKTLINSKSAGNAFIIDAKLNEKVIGALYGFYSRDRIAYFNAGFDSDFAKLSLGLVMIYKVIGWGINENKKYFDFLRGNESYKKSWTSLVEENKSFIYSRGGWISNGPLTKDYFLLSKKRNGLRQTFSVMIKDLF